MQYADFKILLRQMFAKRVDNLCKKTEAPAIPLSAAFTNRTLMNRSRRETISLMIDGSTK